MNLVNVDFLYSINYFKYDYSEDFYNYILEDRVSTVLEVVQDLLLNHIEV